MRLADTPAAVGASTPRIVALALNPWDGPWMNRQQILSRLGRKYPVLYSTGAWSTWDIGDARWRHASWRGGFDRRDSVWVDRPPAALLRVRNRPSIDRWVLRLVARRWRARIRGGDRQPIVGYVFHPRMWPFLEALSPDIVVYHAYDLFRLQVGWSEAIAEDERRLVRRADIVLGSSEVICDELRAQGARHPHVLPNAADYDAFAIEPEDPEPEDLRAIPRPRIGYLGKLSRKVDLTLIGALAERHPDWQFVFIGSTDNLDAESAGGRARVQMLRNVHFLGFKPHTALPHYAVRMDVNVICHRVGSGLWTEGTFPLKLFEYLAAGPPVVSSDIPSVRPYAAVVALARDAAEWERTIADALAERGGVNAREERRAVARQNTWDDRVAHIDRLLAERLHQC